MKLIDSHVLVSKDINAWLNWFAIKFKRRHFVHHIHKLLLLLYRVQDIFWLFCRTAFALFTFYCDGGQQVLLAFIKTIWLWPSRHPRYHRTRHGHIPITPSVFEVRFERDLGLNPIIAVIVFEYLMNIFSVKSVFGLSHYSFLGFRLKLGKFFPLTFMLFVDRV